MSGSTYRVDAAGALTLLVMITALGLVALTLRRWLSLISVGDGMAAARGLAVGPARLILLVLARALVAAVTALMGRVAFVGLIAPQMAALVGARAAHQQIVAINVDRPRAGPDPGDDVEDGIVHLGTEAGPNAPNLDGFSEGTLFFEGLAADRALPRLFQSFAKDMPLRKFRDDFRPVARIFGDGLFVVRWSGRSLERKDEVPS
jgi:hypothetical protein